MSALKSIKNQKWCKIYQRSPLLAMQSKGRQKKAFKYSKNQFCCKIILDFYQKNKIKNNMCGLHQVCRSLQVKKCLYKNEKRTPFYKKTFGMFYLHNVTKLFIL